MPKPKNGHVLSLKSFVVLETLQRISTASGIKKKTLITKNFRALIY